MPSIIFNKLLNRAQAMIGAVTLRGASGDSFSFSAETGRLRFNGRETVLRPKTAALLTLLKSEAGRTHSKQELLNRLWPDVCVQDQAVFQCVSEIRRAFGTRECIRTHPRQGYQWVGPSTTPKFQKFPSRTAWIAASLCLTLLVVSNARLAGEAADIAPTPVRIAILPATVMTESPRDAALPLGFMEAVARFADTENAEIMPASAVLASFSDKSEKSSPALREILNADLLVETSVRRKGQTLFLDFIIDAPAGRVEGQYESMSIAWLAEQVAYEIHEAARYSLLAANVGAAHVARHQSMANARTYLFGDQPQLAAQIFAKIATEDSAYLPAQYYSMAAQMALGEPVQTQKIATLSTNAKKLGDSMHEARAFLLYANNAQLNGDHVSARRSIAAGRSIAKDAKLSSLETVFDYTAGMSFFSVGDYASAVRSFELAAKGYQEADCVIGMLRTYNQLATAYRKIGASDKAQIAASKITALGAIFPEANRSTP